MNQKVQKLGVPAMSEHTTIDEMICPFEEYVKKGVGNPLSFTKDTLNFFSEIRASITLIAKKHSLWFEKCKNINSVTDGWTETLSRIRIPHANKAKPAVARFKQELGKIETFSESRCGEQSERGAKLTAAAHPLA
ncbi:hypothetical protein KI387_015364 [Taxus chinensis]|uniref:Uncharacterized protein n=1 Tax=Taxus chinensis TaxID=29808 RepID=A0AA38GF08_TAXCH|nr:hypothetical protein KI387_015364 [Taxus chinensis]